MNCFTHSRNAAVGMCALCQKGVCHECVASATPRLVCRACDARGAWPTGWYGYGWYGYGYEYKSSTTIAGWPLIHVCSGIDPVTMRPRIAKGVVAIGNIAVGALAIGGVACGLLTVGGASIGLLLAIGGAALGTGRLGRRLCDGIDRDRRRRRRLRLRDRRRGLRSGGDRRAALRRGRARLRRRWFDVFRSGHWIGIVLPPTCQ